MSNFKTTWSSNKLVKDSSSFWMSDSCILRELGGELSILSSGFGLAIATCIVLEDSVSPSSSEDASALSVRSAELSRVVQRLQLSCCVKIGISGAPAAIVSGTSISTAQQTP